jgi:hypothetical protein
MSDELPFDEATATDDLSDEPASFSSAVSAVGGLENSRRDSSIS